MAYIFTYHALMRLKDYKLSVAQGRTLFEKAQPCIYRKRGHRTHKLEKYGGDQLDTEYWYNMGMVFVTSRKPDGTSVVLTAHSMKRGDVIIKNGKKKN